MGRYTKKLFEGRDWVVFLVSVLLAFSVWLIHNLSLTYSNFAQLSVIAGCELDGHAPVAAEPVEIAARCDLSGYSLMMLDIIKHRKPLSVEVSKEDMHHYQGDFFYMTSSDLTKYYHDFFGEKTRLEYFVSDTVFFRFPSVSYKKVPVSPLLNISYKSQYMPTASLRLMPDSVLVYGETSLFESVESVDTDVIRIASASSDVYGEVALREVSGLRLSEKNVSYLQPVRRYVQTKVTLPVGVKNLPRDCEMMVVPSTVTLTICSVFPGSAKLSDASVDIDYEDFEKSRRGGCKGYVSSLPAGVISCEMSPKVFKCYKKTAR